MQVSKNALFNFNFDLKNKYIILKFEKIINIKIK